MMSQWQPRSEASHDRTGKAVTMGYGIGGIVLIVVIVIIVLLIL
jgi:hypothetical protein